MTDDRRVRADQRPSGSTGPRAAIVVFGTRGDLDPHLALARAVRERGGRPVIVSFAEHGPAVAEHGIDFSPVPGSLPALLATSEGQSFATTRNPMTLMRAWRWLGEDLVSQVIPPLESVLADADVVVIGGYTSGLAAVVAHRLGVPAPMTLLQPAVPTSEHPLMVLPVTNLGPLNRPSWTLPYRAQWVVMGDLINEVCASQGVPGFDSSRQFMDFVFSRTVLNGWSPTVAPYARDWPANVHSTGRWVLPARRAMSSGVRDFLDSGSSPVYVGLGSMVVDDPERTVELFVESVRSVGRRAVLSSGWAGLGSTGDRSGLPTLLSSDVLLVGDEPHAELFPRCAAIMHHCGAGTAQTAAAAGRASVPVPFGMDQPFWARRLQALGVAGPPVPRRRWTTQRLRASLRRALQPSVVDRAELVGAKMRAESDGALVAAELILNECD